MQILSSSINKGSYPISSSNLKRILKADIKMKMKAQSHYLSFATKYLGGKSWEVKNQIEIEGSKGTYIQIYNGEEVESKTCRHILELPDDVWLGILSHLQMVDVGR
jgi:hypothetical protein